MRKKILKLILPLSCVATPVSLCQLVSCSQNNYTFFNNFHYVDFDNIQDLGQAHMADHLDVYFRMLTPIPETYSVEFQVMWSETTFPSRWGEFFWKETPSPVGFYLDTTFRYLFVCRINRNAVPLAEDVAFFENGEKINFSVLARIKDSETGKLVDSKKFKFKLINRVNG